MVERARASTRLQEYEQLKFELADVIRSALLATSGEDRRSGPWPDLMSRLADDRFTVAVAGRFSRGKSSLMNAMLGLDRLPTGMVPLTSVITYVRYGTNERVLLDFLGTRLRGEAPLEQLADYVTERGNPGNAKRLRSAEIQLPAEILRRGFFFVDTPGLGSAILENTETTERFIPEIDMLILVTAFESPISEDECRFLRRASRAVRAVFVAINKQDVVPAGERREVVEYVEKRVGEVLEDRTFRLFSVSAKDGLAAKLANDAEGLRESGIEDLETELVRLLAQDRSRLFLSSVCDRAAAEIASLPDQVRDDLSQRLESLRARFDGGTCSKERSVPHVPGHSTNPTGTAPRMDVGCEVCKAVLDEQFGFLARYQLELSARSRAQDEHAEHGGFCPFHTWHYEQISSPRAVCTAYPALLLGTANRLRELAMESDRAISAERWPAPRCLVCKLRRETEDRIVGSILERIVEDRAKAEGSALCLPHLRLALARSGDATIRELLLSQEAARIERIAEDMQRYAVKLDGLRRWLTSDEEQNASLHALQALAGHRNVNAIAPLRDLL